MENDKFNMSDVSVTTVTPKGQKHKVLSYSGQVV